MARVRVWEHDFRYGLFRPRPGVNIYIARGPTCARCNKTPAAAARSKKKARRAVYGLIGRPHRCETFDEMLERNAARIAENIKQNNALLRQLGEEER